MESNDNNKNQPEQPKEEIKRLKEKNLPEHIKQAVRKKEQYVNKPFNK